MPTVNFGLYMPEVDYAMYIKNKTQINENARIALRKEIDKFRSKK